VSLIDYAQAKPLAEAIKQQVCSRKMPPWNAVKGFGDFKNDPSLTQEDIEIIAEWVEGGAPEGNPAYLPPRPDFPAATSKSDANGSTFNISGAKVIKQPTMVIAIKPAGTRSAETQVIAKHPDGSLEPLLWTAGFNPIYKEAYYFRQPLFLEAGTLVQVLPADGTVSLIVKSGKEPPERKGR